VPNPFRALFAAPLLRRIGFHARRIGGQMDRHFFTSLLTAVVGFVVIAAVAVTVLEEDRLNVAGFGNSFYWAVTTVIGSGDASYVASPGGFVVGWVLAFFGVAMVAAMTGAIVGFVIDYLLKEGQGMGAAGYTDHIVVCGWNETARDLIEELKGDEFTTKVVVLHDAERNPAGDGVYFVRGDITSTDDLELSELVTDIVSGGEGSELYRVALPYDYIGLSVDELSTRLRGDHRATLLAVTRDGRSMTNPPADFRLQTGDDAVVVAEGLGELRPLELQHA